MHIPSPHNQLTSGAGVVLAESREAHRLSLSDVTASTPAIEEQTEPTALLLADKDPAGGMPGDMGLFAASVLLCVSWTGICGISWLPSTNDSMITPSAGKSSSGGIDTRSSGATHTNCRAGVVEAGCAGGINRCTGINGGPDTGATWRSTFTLALVGLGGAGLTLIVVAVGASGCAGGFTDTTLSADETDASLAC